MEHLEFGTLGLWGVIRRLTRVSLTERVPVDSESKTMKHSLISGSEAMVDLMWKGGQTWQGSPKKREKIRLQNIGRGKAVFSRPQKG